MIGDRRYVVDAETGCWVWSGALTNGYASIGVGDNVFLAHRLSYALHRGGIPYQLEIDHLCRNRKCINPDHLEMVTRAENSRRGARAKLTKETVALIRSTPAEIPNRVLAGQLGVSKATVQSARSGRSWT